MIRERLIGEVAVDWKDTVGLVKGFTDAISKMAEAATEPPDVQMLIEGFQMVMGALEGEARPIKKFEGTDAYGFRFYQKYPGLK